MTRRAELAVLGGSFLAVLAWSGVAPHDRGVWVLEVSPAVIGVAIVAATERRMPLSRLTLVCIWIHALVLCVGGHYTYALVPAGDWARDAFGLARNPYDRLGHVAQGVFPAIVTREVLLRTSTLRRGRWLAFLVVSVCLAVSAMYELVEWWVAVFLAPDEGVAFLAMQGDPWDTQWDMFLALCGAIGALALLSRVHDRSMAAVTTS